MNTRPSAYEIPSVQIALALARPRRRRWWQWWFWLLLCLWPLPASASVVYNWTGTCASLCVGPATLHVVTTDAYVPGTDYSKPDASSVLLQALYHDSQITVDFATKFNGPNGSWLTLPAGSGSAAGLIHSETLQFSEVADGTWRSGGEGLAPGCGPQSVAPPLCGYVATGTGGVWTLEIPTLVFSAAGAPVPGPATLVLVLAGVLPLVVVATAYGTVIDLVNALDRWLGRRRE